MNELLMQGIAVMCIGMGTVLLFLCTMICFMFIMSFVIKKLNVLFPEIVVQSAGSKKTSITDSADVAVAILAALKKKN